MARVVVVEDHVLVRDALRRMVEDSGHSIIGQANAAPAALRLIGEASPDLAVLDLNLGGREPGLQLVRRLRAQYSDVRLVIFSMWTNIRTIDAAYNAGAAAYVTKVADPNLLVVAINTVLGGRLYFMPGIAEQLTEMRLRGVRQDPTALLSSKELELFRLLAGGLTNEDAAAALDMTPKNVANRVLGIKHKLNCSRSDFMQIAVQHGLLHVPL